MAFPLSSFHAYITGITGAHGPLLGLNCISSPSKLLSESTYPALTPPTSTTMAPKQPAPRRSTRSTKGKVPERLVNDPATTFKVAKTKPKKKEKIPEPPRPPINRRARGLKEVRGLERMVASLDDPLQASLPEAEEA